MSSGLLLDEPCLVIQPALVRRLGHLSDAAVLQQIHYWIARSRNQRAGYRWVYKTYEEWSSEIGISTKQIRAAIVRLEERGLLISCQPEAYHRRKWYRIDYEHSLLHPIPEETIDHAESGSSIGPNGIMESLERDDGKSETGLSRAEITHENTQKIPRETPASLEVLDEHQSECLRLAMLLADLVEANGSKRPSVSAKWTSTIDRMIRLDGRDPQQIEAAIRWSQADEFWQANILSPEKLRKQFDRMRLQASRSRSNAGAKGLAGVRDYLAGLDD